MPEKSKPPQFGPESKSIRQRLSLGLYKMQGNELEVAQASRFSCSKKHVHQRSVCSYVLTKQVDRCNLRMWAGLGCLRSEDDHTRYRAKVVHCNSASPERDVRISHKCESAFCQQQVLSDGFCCACRYTVLESIKAAGEHLKKKDPLTGERWKPEQWIGVKGLEIEAFCVTMFVWMVSVANTVARLSSNIIAPHRQSYMIGMQFLGPQTDF